ncbi:hypothetical protein CPB83DRAFT_232053 [Crepidotus variabilis]|uniref:Uncharacterized protein n=1 Tax=Crepidotus variabilis TaxID=179855 RepID=A0A9P6JWX1_9AGAR|nr:hypothetical protein CPB83DRAFT_232053 [Crepidotus variabilis]
MLSTYRQYFILSGSVVLLFLTVGLIHQIVVPQVLLHVSMAKTHLPQSEYGVGMRPYSLMGHPPLNDTYSSPTLNRIAVVMSVHSDEPLYRASFESHQRYCQLHGYRFMTQSKNMLPEEPFPHPRGHEYQKMAVLMQALMVGLDTDDFDWILWTDLDTYVIDPSVPLESFLPPPYDSTTGPEPYFLGNRDWNGFNAGALFIKVIPWSVQLIAMVIADPYILYTTGALDDSRDHKPATNDQASLSRIFQTNSLFGKHFQEIPSNWMNTYPPSELDGKLNTTIPHLLPSKVEEWVKAMDDHTATRQLESKRRWQRPRWMHRSAPPSPLDNDTLEQLKQLRDLPSTFIPSQFKDILQIHLVDGRKWSFDYLSLVSINAQMMQVATGALVYHYHENLPLGGEGAAVRWEEEKRRTLVGLKHIQNPGLFERRDKWYRERKVGVEGMTWLDGRSETGIDR